LRTPAAILKDYFGLTDLPGLAPRSNIAPSQPVGAVRATDSGRQWVELRWGLVPSWAKDPSIGNRMINARAETVAEKPAFREAFEQRRCLIPADGFYEWRKLDGGGKQPYYLSRTGSEPFAFAGLWDRWRDRLSGVVIESCTVITTTPNELLAPIHDRMPVMLDREGASEWVRTDAVPGALDVLLQPFPASAMRAEPVSNHVNRPANDDRECVAPITLTPDRPRLF
jgi:putative SOS response-associated peptidase YedK